VLNDRGLLHNWTWVLASFLITTGGAYAANPPPPPCDACAAWNVPQKPLRIYGNTYYVGVHGLSSLLITSDHGHVLIDGGSQESAAQIAASIKALGFRVRDIKLILNSHDHFDHAGGIAELQKLSGANVAALALSAKVLEQGFSDPNDPQYGPALLTIPKVKSVRVVQDGETVRVGELALTAHATPGHTPGSTTWTWKSCEDTRCLNMVYADSLMPISSSTFKFSSSKDYPNAVADFEKSYATLSALPCDILMTPHPEVSNLFARIDKRDSLVDTEACKRYAESGKQKLTKRLAEEAAQ
jgi:metallo-beta-lactamase class B